MPFIPHTEKDTAQMLERIGLRHLDDLFASIPAQMRPKSFQLPEGLPEHEVLSRFREMAAKNATDLISFMGAGAYDHATPAAVDALAGRGELYTPYTPYQAEASQGTLQAIFEYQTAVCRLLDMDVANASVYDGGSALFEGAMMAVRATKRDVIVVDECVNPLYRNIMATLSANLPISLRVIAHKQGGPDMESLEAALDETTAAVVVQNPGFLGAVLDFSGLFARARALRAKAVMLVNPVMQAVLKTPGEMGADVAVAEGQALGLPLAFGGPYLGIMTCSKDMVRQMPGRIAGRTEDLEGRTGYVLTLQAREQHIRRSRATSNICSNQSLCALRCVMHLALLGPEGLTRTAELAMQRAREAAAALSALPGVSLYSDAPYGYEFALALPKNAFSLARALAEQKIIAGLPVGRWYAGLDTVLLVACTEKTTAGHIGRLAEAMAGALQ